MPIKVDLSITFIKRLSECDTSTKQKPSKDQVTSFGRIKVTQSGPLTVTQSHMGKEAQNQARV